MNNSDRFRQPAALCARSNQLISQLRTYTQRYYATLQRIIRIEFRSAEPTVHFPIHSSDAIPIG